MAKKKDMASALGSDAAYYLQKTAEESPADVSAAAPTAAAPKEDDGLNIEMKDRRVSLYLAPEIAEKIKILCWIKGISKNKFIESMLRRELDTENNQILYRKAKEILKNTL